MNLSNVEVARMLHEVAAAYTLKKASLFQIRAYENAAFAVENSTSEIKDLWQEGRMDELPGIGKSLTDHLEELFKTGKVKHWETVKKGIPQQTFDFLEIPGIGPKTALELNQLGIKDVQDLKEKITDGSLVKKGFSDKIAERISDGLKQIPFIKSGRMLLPYAFAQAEKILDYLKKNHEIEKADALGSLRRMVSTIGDLDFAIASKSPKEVIDYIVKMPDVSDIVDQGETKVTIVLSSGLHLDFLIVEPKSYGSLLQHFTGSKAHNIHLRTIAEKGGLSLSEYGVKKVQKEELIKCETEDELYSMLGMQTPPPELREDSGEIEVALKHQLPKLIELKNIKGDSYTVIEGDWLSKIAGRAYGDIMAFDKIAKANNITDPNLIEVGQVLKIPR